MDGGACTLLLGGERLDDLGDGISIISNKDLYCFTSDAVRLSNAVRGSKTMRLIDLCSGAGVIPLLVAKKTTIGTIIGVEIQHELADMASRSALLNNLSDRISILSADLRGIEESLGRGCFDIITCNPPYFKANSGVARLSPPIAMARHELTCTLEDIIKTAAGLLKYGGKLIMVHKCERMAEVFALLKQYKLEPKELTTYQPTANKPCDTFIVIAKSNASVGMIINNYIVEDKNL